MTNEQASKLQNKYDSERGTKCIDFIQIIVIMLRDEFCATNNRELRIIEVRINKILLYYAHNL